MEIFKIFVLLTMINIAIQIDVCKGTNECNIKEEKDCRRTTLTGNYADKCQCCWHELLGNKFCGPESKELAKEVGKKKKFDIGYIYCKQPSSSSFNKVEYIFIIILIFLYI